MIFAQTLDKLVKDGIKTQTRRPVKHGEICVKDDNGRITAVYGANGRLKWAVGRDYAIQPGRGKPGIPGYRIKITAIRWEPLDYITDSDASDEGFNHREEFFEVWDSLYGGLRPNVYVLVFDLIEVNNTIQVG